ncbi:BamA/TamA family outer membrane protein, partial [Candidatus Desantisbacteria bacterium]|nr:BamA/TamA family outer membrane protein [Candidatus Desantisbacteria bacterium]
GPKDGGNVLVVSNVELRFPIYKKFYGVLFYDGGQAYDKWAEVNSTTFRYSRGIGLRYHTIVVPFRIDYGEKVKRLPGESPGQFYISIGQAF